MACPVCGKVAAARHYRMAPFVTALGDRGMRAEWCNGLTARVNA